MTREVEGKLLIWNGLSWLLQKLSTEDQKVGRKIKDKPVRECLVFIFIIHHKILSFYTKKQHQRCSQFSTALD